MIPTIEDILNGLLDGTYLLDKAVRMVEQHIETVGLRDHFAGLAMQGLVTNIKLASGEHRIVAIGAYNIADAMLEARK